MEINSRIILIPSSLFLVCFFHLISHLDIIWVTTQHWWSYWRSWGRVPSLFGWRASFRHRRKDTNRAWVGKRLNGMSLMDIKTKQTIWRLHVVLKFKAIGSTSRYLIFIAFISKFSLWRRSRSIKFFYLGLNKDWERKSIFYNVNECEFNEANGMSLLCVCGDTRRHSRVNKEMKINDQK